MVVVAGSWGTPQNPAQQGFRSLDVYINVRADGVVWLLKYYCATFDARARILLLIVPLTTSVLVLVY